MATAIVDQVVLVQKQYRNLMRQVAQYFGRNYCAPRFGRVVENQPKVMTKHPYINYLRHYKIRHPRLGFNRMLQSAARAWRQLTPKEKSMYSQKEVLRRIQNRTIQRHKLQSHLGSNKPLTYHRRTMSASRNARNSWRRSQLPRRNTRNPIRKHIWQI